MENKDIRWIQRFNNYRKALAQLDEAIKLSEKRHLSKLENQGLIKAFEFTYELAWNTLQDFLREIVDPKISGGPKVIIARAIAEGYLLDENGWKEIHESRKNAAHTYNQDTADEIVDNIIATYFDLFIQLETRLQVEKLKQTGE
jgi:nucleotidyltransferase substrate binding protein (TIGR01987 family)